MVKLDAWVEYHPWHPRVLPFVVYVVGFVLVGKARHAWPGSYPALYVIQCIAVAWLLWRYRRLTPELTIRFHWLAVPVGVLVLLAWLWLGIWMDQFPRIGYNLGPYTRDFFVGLITGNRNKLYWNDSARDFIVEMGPVVGWLSLSLRLLGMSLLVPLFEELFVRSMLLRSLNSPRRTLLGLLQFFQDLPVLGEWFGNTKLGERVENHPPVFGQEFERTPLGSLSLFGVAASTFLFTINHRPNDYPGAVFCGVAYCLLLAATRNKGLGPVIWAHGITNALLWGYTIWTGDGRFL